MEQTTQAATAHARPTKLKALAMLVGAMGMSAGFIALCGFLGNQEFYAGFLFLLCWAVMEHTKLERLPHAVIGSAFGVALGFALQYLLGNAIPMGGLIFTAVVMVVLYCQFLGWLPIIANLSAFTFLLVVTMSHVQAHADFRNIAVSLALGVVYFVPIIATAKHFANRAQASTV